MPRKRHFTDALPVSVVEKCFEPVTESAVYIHITSSSTSSSFSSSLLLSSPTFPPSSFSSSSYSSSSSSSKSSWFSSSYSFPSSLLLILLPLLLLLVLLLFLLFVLLLLLLLLLRRRRRRRLRRGFLRLILFLLLLLILLPLLLLLLALFLLLVLLFCLFGRYRICACVQTELLQPRREMCAINLASLRTTLEAGSISWLLLRQGKEGRGWVGGGLCRNTDYGATGTLRVLFVLVFLPYVTLSSGKASCHRVALPKLL